MKNNKINPFRAMETIKKMCIFQFIFNIQNENFLLSFVTVHVPKISPDKNMFSNESFQDVFYHNICSYGISNHKIHSMSVLSHFFSSHNAKCARGVDLTFRKRKPSGFCESEITKSCTIIAWSLVEEPAAIQPLPWLQLLEYIQYMRERNSVLCFSSFPQSPRAIGNPRKRRRPILFSLPLVDFWFSLIPSRLSSVIREKLSVSTSFSLSLSLFSILLFSFFLYFLFLFFLLFLSVQYYITSVCFFSSSSFTSKKNNVST